MNSHNARPYGPSKVRDLGASSGRAMAFRRRHLPTSPRGGFPHYRRPAAGLVEFVASTPEPSPKASSTLVVSQNATGVAVAEGVGFSPTRGSNPHLAMSRSGAASAQTKSSTCQGSALLTDVVTGTEREKRLALEKMRDYYEN